VAWPYSSKPSFGLIDQLRTIDKRRIRSVFGEITDDEMEAADEGIRLFLGLSDIAIRS
jgi:mRNA-degrading endonuclease toxin of MazEF toxin-antitoxin module